MLDYRSEGDFMKFKWDKKLNTYAIYAFLVISASIVFYLIASEVRVFRIQVGKYLNVFSPFIIGFVMAYLFNFIMSFVEKKFLEGKKYKRQISIIITYSIVLLFMLLFIKFIFPQLVDSLIGLVNEIPRYVKEVGEQVTKFLENLNLSPENNQVILEKWDDTVNFVVKFVTGLIPKIGNMTKSIIASIWNIVLGLIISIYLLSDKEYFKALYKKVITSLFSEKRAEQTLTLTEKADDVFGKFVSGKIIDSIIIGILTYFVLLIFKYPYVSLIAFIIGITNVIPFFGPFIGAIPSVFIIAFESLPLALWFIVIIFIIQQIDGNIIGPKILGDSLGISSFWILFSLLVSGKLFGLVGLLVGVPVFVLFYAIFKEFIENRLKNKGLPEDTNDYN